MRRRPGQRTRLPRRPVYVYDPLHYLVLSVPLAVKAGVVEASPETPFLSLLMLEEDAGAAEAHRVG